MKDMSTKTTLFSNATYDVLKHVVQVVLPAFATLYIGLAELWPLPNPLAVAGTVSLLATFLGVTLKISNTAYNKQTPEFDGTLVIDTTDPETDIYRLEVDVPIAELDKKDRVLVRVSHV